MAIPNRLKWEWDQLQKNAEYDDMYLIPTDDGWHTWEGCIPGPASSPYKNANFRIFIKLPDDYPFHSPQVKFNSKIWHPNICPITGKINLKDWSPSQSLQDILKYIQKMLISPDENLRMNNIALTQFSKCRETFEKLARSHAMFHFHGEEHPGQPNPFEAEHQKLDLASYIELTLPAQRADRIDPLNLRQLWAADAPLLGAARTVMVPSGSAEHAFVAARVAESIPGATVGEVRRVESPGQLETFEARVRASASAAGGAWNGGRMVRWLFHGTSAAAAERIAAEPVVGFRVAMSLRCCYGRGIYFAEESSVSFSYAENGTMILAPVMVGPPPTPWSQSYGDQGAAPGLQSLRRQAGALWRGGGSAGHQSLHGGDGVFVIQVRRVPDIGRARRGFEPMRASA